MTIINTKQLHLELSTKCNDLWHSRFDQSCKVNSEYMPCINVVVNQELNRYTQMKCVIVVLENMDVWGYLQEWLHYCFRTGDLVRSVSDPFWRNRACNLEIVLGLHSNVHDTTLANMLVCNMPRARLGSSLLSLGILLIDMSPCVVASP